MPKKKKIKQRDRFSLDPKKIDFLCDPKNIEYSFRMYYARVLVDLAMDLIEAASVRPTMHEIQAVEEPDDLTPSAFSTGCYAESPEDKILEKEFIQSSLSSEARKVLDIILTTPKEVTQALMKITITGGERPETLKKPTLEQVYHPDRLRRYCNRVFGIPTTNRVWKELKKVVPGINVGILKDVLYNHPHGKDKNN